METAIKYRHRASVSHGALYHPLLLLRLMVIAFSVQLLEYVRVGRTPQTLLYAASSMWIEDGYGSVLEYHDTYI